MISGRCCMLQYTYCTNTNRDGGGDNCCPNGAFCNANLECEACPGGKWTQGFNENTEHYTFHSCDNVAAGNVLYMITDAYKYVFYP